MMAPTNNGEAGRASKYLSIAQALETARAHERQRQIGQASALYAQIVRSYPSTTEAKECLVALALTTPAVKDPPEETLSALHTKTFGNSAQLHADAAALLPEYPDSFVLWMMVGTSALQMMRWTTAEMSLRRALALRPESALANFHLCNALKAQGRLEDALVICDLALVYRPDSALLHDCRAATLFAIGDINNAMEAWNAATNLDPGFASAHHGKGLAFRHLGDLRNAISALQKAIEINPDFDAAHENLGMVYLDLGDLMEARAAFDRALALNPNLSISLSLRHSILAKICAFSASGNTSIRDDHTVWGALAFEDNPGRHQKRAMETWHRIAGSIKSLPLPARPSVRSPKLRIGYFSADFHNHATMHLLAGVFREHDRERFDINAYSYGPAKTDPYRENLIKSGLKFHDISAMPDGPVAEMVRSHHLDIAIDLKGFTTGSRLHLFAHKLAPIQISYLGFPGTSGTDVFDYMIADRTVVPHRHRQYYSEKILYLPHSYQANDCERLIANTTTTRADFGLPQEGMVFCCFNTSSKIGANEFDIWMRVLNKVPGSVLWLLRSNAWMEENLRKEAAMRGVSPDRIILCDMAPPPEHLARYRHADLFLDTFHCNAHTTASDALWGGVPVVTKAGQQFAARVAASLLNAVGLADLVTETEEQYEGKIIDLASQPRLLSEIKERLAANRTVYPLFDTIRFTRNFEACLERAYERFHAGEMPADMDIPDYKGSPQPFEAQGRTR